MKRLCVLFAVLLFIITGCGTETDSKESNSMPKEMPDMFDFIVRFGYGDVNKNEINTYQDTATKDLIAKGTATANITLTMEEMRSIYEKMREINIMGTKELVPAKMRCSQVPYSEDSWKININGETKTFTWSDENCEITDDAAQLLELRNFIQHIVAGKEAYKVLPESEGGYE